jgi:hypothetical protein
MEEEPKIPRAKSACGQPGTEKGAVADWFVEACRYASVRAAAPWLCHDFCRRALARFVGFMKRNSEERKNAVVVALVVLQV